MLGDPLLLALFLVLTLIANAALFALAVPRKLQRAEARVIDFEAARRARR